MEVTDHRHIEGQGMLIEDGDFALVESEQDHIRDIILDNKGEWKQWPVIGVAALNFLNSSANFDDIKKQIQKQLEYDDFKVQSIKQDADGMFKIIARRNETVQG